VDQQLWNQTKLQFNRSGNIEDDPQRSRVGDTNMAQNTSTINSSDYRYAAQDAPQRLENHGSIPPNPKRACTNKNSMSGLSQFAYAVDLTGDDNSDTMAMSVAISQNDSTQDNDLSSSVGLDTRRKRKAKESEIQMSSPLPLSEDVIQTHAPKRERSEQYCEIGASSSASEYVEESFDSAQKSVGPATTDPTLQAPIVWNSFRGTADVVRLSRSSRRRKHHTRRLLREEQLKDKEGQSQRTEKGFPQPGAEESIGLSLNEGVADGLSSASDKERNSVHLTKDDFLNMEIVGQFNLGFILARCRNRNLWILDQHACDEIFNFERLCKTTVLHEQKLISPLPLDLSSIEQHTIMENIDVFEQNGFRFSYDKRKPLRHRLALTALPHSGSGGKGQKAVQFGIEDVGALCSLLVADESSSSGYEGGGVGYGTGADGSGMHDNNAVRRYAGNMNLNSGFGSGTAGVGGSTRSSIVRLPKAIAMFASRACRSSIMIGTALSQKKMEEVVQKMHNVDEPWNCPHGRPTMRHVKGLLDCFFEDSCIASQHINGPSLAVMSQHFENE